MKPERNLNQYINKKIIINFLGAFLSLYSLTAQAQILITEIMYNPEGNDEDREWIEAINLGESINIKTGKQGWRIFDGKNRILKGNNLTWHKGEIIIFVQNANKFLSEYPEVKNKLIESSFYLKNDEGVIKIIEDNKNVLAEFKYNSNLGGNGNGYSLIYENGQVIEGRTYKGSPGIYPEPSQRTEKPKNNTYTYQTVSSSQQTTLNTTSSQQIIQNETNQPTTSKESLKEENKTTSTFSNISQTTPTNSEEYTLLITEFLPNLKGKDMGEFVEIYNYGYKEVDLSKIYLVIGNRKYKLYGNIKPQSYKVFYNTELNFNIRNSGDTLKLMDGKNNIIFSISYYGKSKEDKSFARDDSGNWKWTNPMPGEKNIFLKEEPQSKIENNKDETVTKNYPNDQQEDLNLQNLANVSKNLSRANTYQVIFLGLFLAVVFSIIFLLFFR